MKKLLCLLLPCLLLFSAQASGDICFLDSPNPFYFKIWGGGTVLRNKMHETNIKYEIGPAGGLATGISFLSFLKGEIECFYFQNGIREVKINHRRLGLKGTLQNHSLLFNLRGHVPLYCEFAFNAGLGAGYGWAHIELHNRSIPKIHNHDKHFSWQAIAGLSRPIYQFKCVQIEASLEGRYFAFDKDIHAFIFNLGLQGNF